MADTDSATTRSRHQQKPRSVADVFALRALIAVAAVGAAFAASAPTGHQVVDALWCAGLAAAVTFAASRSRRWAWLWCSGAIAIASVGSWWVIAALAALTLALLGILLPARNRLVGAAVGALVSQAILRLPTIAFHGFSTIVVVVAVAPLLWSAYDRSSIRLRRKAGRIAFVGIGALGLATIVFGISALISRSQFSSAVDSASVGLDLIRDGKQDDGAERLASSAKAFDSAQSTLSGVWTWPAEVVPVVAQHREAVVVAAASGHDLAQTGAAAASSAPYQQLKASKGRIDLSTVGRMQQPVTDAADSLRRAKIDMASVQSSWLVPVLAGPVKDLQTKIDGALPEAELAQQALTEAPALLGADGQRRYLILFTNPAESRFVGGFTGSYGVLTATKGQVDFVVGGRVSDMLAGDPGARVLKGQEEFLARYGRYDPARYLQNLTVSPDFPTDAKVTKAIYEEYSGTSINGVILVDPYAIAALLQLTGPVTVDGMDTPLTAETAANFLIYDQYVDYGDDRSERKDVLEAAGRATFEALTKSDLPGPRQIGKVLGPVVEQKRLLFYTFDDEAQALFDRVGTTGAFAPDLGSDFISLRTANGNPNKIDSKLSRSLSYEASYNPGSGAVSSTATITLANNAPPTGLSPYLIGNEHDKPDGSNTMYLSVYSPLGAVDATLDGADTGLEVQRELGANVYSLVVTVNAWSTRTLVIHLEGTIPANAHYGLQLLQQPVVNDDHVSVRVVSSAKEWQLVGVEDLERKGTAGIADVQSGHDLRFGATFGG